MTERNEQSPEDLIAEALAAVEASGGQMDEDLEEELDGVSIVEQPVDSQSQATALEAAVEAAVSVVSNGADGEESVTERVPEQPVPTVLASDHDELKARYLRLMADFDNFRKRVHKEKAELRRFGPEAALRDLLAVVDNIDRALSLGEEAETGLFEGVSMIRAQMVGVFERFGAKRFASSDETFDPELHEAVAHAPHATVASGKVCEELQVGYTFFNRLLRPASVIVSAGNLDNDN
jgi:molecular chaperone GrpE